MNKIYGEGDSYLINECDELKHITLDEIKKEIKFYEMKSQGIPVPRLVAIEGEKTEFGYPLYRHPSDEQPQITDFSPITIKIKTVVSKHMQFAELVEQ